MTVERTKQDLLDLIAGDKELTDAFEEGMYAQRAAHLITQMRMAEGISKTELARRLGVSLPRISEAEKAKGPHGPTFRFMCEVASACGFVWPASIADLRRRETADDTTDNGDGAPNEPKGGERDFYLIEAEPVETGDTPETALPAIDWDTVMGRAMGRIRLVGLATMKPDGTVVVPAVTTDRLRTDATVRSVVHRWEQVIDAAPDDAVVVESGDKSLATDS